MDDTQPSRVSDAAATRKRRSSILKSQRPTRTPFSELEFNVATPTDTAKSRRVSFSKRTGVAEFVTNEATTTWKNFYEEHNKSLESSGNDSEVKATRQPVEHLGKRIFDQQFEEVEAVDFMGSLNPYLGNNSLNNINFTEQIASLECPSDIKLNPPRNNFELSALTDHHSKLFGNDFTVTGVGEMSGRIEINFSTVQHIGGKDDLDDIERDLERGSNVVCLGPSDQHDISEYIEVDLNMTNVVKNDDCDMSITDTVHSPKVQDISKSCSIDKKNSVNKDLVFDKENIAINPYAAPRESDNFAVNDVLNQVLVFDGKRLTLQTEKSDKEYRKTLLPSTATETPQRKTIVLNMDDDLPNFVSDVSTKFDIDSKHSNIYNDFDLSTIPHMNKLDIVPRRQTEHDNMGNISITQALPSKIISGDAEKRRTIVYGEEDNISITQALPSEIISGPGRRGTMVYNKEDSNISITQALLSNIVSDKRQTLVHDVDEEVNISVTQALPSNIISGAADKCHTMVYEQEDGNISMTQALSTNIISEVAERHRTVAHNAESSVNLSITQALPSNIISGITDRRRTLVYDQDDGNISMTQALPSNIISGAAEKHRTIIYDDDMDTNISITQALPSKIINAGEEKRRTKVFDQEDASISLTQGLPSNILSGNAEKRRTIIYNDDNGEANISMTQVLPSNIVSGAEDKRRTMVFDDDEANISITQTLPTKLISGATDKRQTKIFDQDETNNLSITQAISVQIITDSVKPTERRRTVLYENDSGNISITQMLPASILQSDDPVLNEIHKTVIFDESNGNISVTKSVPVNLNVEQNVPQKQKTIVFDDDDGNIIIDTECEETRRTVIYDDTTGNISITQSALTNMNLSQRPSSPEKRRTIVYQDNTGNISVTQGFESKESTEVLSTNITLKDTHKRRTIVFEKDTGNISVMQAIPSQLQGFDSKSTMTATSDDKDTHKRRTIVFENDTGNISATQAIPSQLQGFDSKSTMTATSDDMSTNSLLTYNEDVAKPKTIINDEDTKDISAAQPIYANIIKPSEDVDKDKSIVIKQDDCKKPSEKKASTVAFLLSGIESHSYGKLEDISGTIDDKIRIDGGDSAMSIAEIDPKVQHIEGLINKNIKIDGNDTNNVSRPIPVDLMALHDNISNVLVTKEPSSTAQVTNQNQDVLLYPSTTSVESHFYGKLEDISGTIDDKIRIDGGDSAMSIAEIDPKVQHIEGLINKNIKIDGNDTNNVSRPIPVDLMALHDNILNVLVTKEPSSTAQVTNQNRDVLLYLSTTSDIAPTVNKIEPDRLIYEAPFDENDSNMTSSSKIHNIDDSECLSTKECSEDPSLQSKENAGHVIESKLDVYNMQDNVRDEAMDVDKQSDKHSSSSAESTFRVVPKSSSTESTFRVVPKSSILDALLDLSDITLQRQTEKTAVSAESLPPNDAEPIQMSNESLFYIIKEEDALMQTEKEKSNELAKPADGESNLPPLIEDVMVADETNVLNSSVLQNKLNELHLEHKCGSGSPENLEVVAETELENIVESDNHKPVNKSFKNANDTNELLDMISNFTDKTRCELEDDPVPPTIVQENVAVENKIEPIRLSLAPNRQSIVFSREDLLNNMSMAQAALQKSRIVLDDSKTDETQDTFTEEETNTSPKSDRMSSVVVKTLHFDDESISACSIKSDASKQSPLRKTAFGETSYMKDSKANVIPTYLKEVTDSIKELMTDLVKPMTDVLPFTSNTERVPEKTNSTISMQIQANLVTSSQIDMEDMLSSNSNSDCAMENASSFCLRNNILKVPSLSMKWHPSHSEERPLRPKCAPEDSEQILIFDHLNPLNNILLGPLDYTNAHTYNPGPAPINQLLQRSDETLCGSEHSASCQANGETAIKDCDMMTKYNVSMMLLPKKKAYPEKLVGGVSEVVAEEQSAVIHTTYVKNAEVNTIIAMKENKELLNASSSLTLVDEAMAETTTDDNTSKTESDSSKELQNKDKRSPFRIIYKVKELDGFTVMEKVESNTAPQEDKQIKNKKRNYIPSSLITAVLPNMDITPKPKSKMQKISNTPVKFNLDVNNTATKITAERDIETHEPVNNEKVDLKPRKNSPRKNKCKPNSPSFNMQQMITDYHVETVINESVLRKKCSEAMKSECSNAYRTSQSVLQYNSLEDVNSFTSSINFHALKSGESASTNMFGLKSQYTESSVQSCKLRWHPNISSLSSRPSVIDSGVNIVAKIDMLPFMGSHECEWEFTTADTWCFRLLHRRIRLMVRLAHSQANAIKSRVRADTPVHDITVETIQYDKRNPVSTLCMRFACETMRYMVSRTRSGGQGEVLARAVPALLRRCAAVARVALRWGRAMHDTKMQLAYSLNNDGHLTLKVANISLRSVWEVSLILELVVLDAGLAPWPRAGEVRVTPVVSNVVVNDADVRRLLAATPQDWGHAPRVIWRLFRYLKNKTRDDDLLLGV